jgi:hypothetical protein
MLQNQYPLSPTAANSLTTSKKISGGDMLNSFRMLERSLRIIGVNIKDFGIIELQRGSVANFVNLLRVILFSVCRDLALKV